MARAWDTISYGESALTLTGGLGATRTVTATHTGGAYPNSHVSATSITLNIAESSSGIGPPTGEWGIAVVEDGGEANQNYTVAGVVLAYVAVGTGGSLPASVNVTGLNKGGQYRLVLMAGDNAANAQNSAGVSTAGLSTDFHHDSDGGTTRGGSAANASTRVVGAAGHRVHGTAITPTAGNWRYGQTNQIAFSIRPAGNPTGAIINPKQLKLSLTTDTAGAARPDGVYRITPNTTGDATATGITVDTDFAQTLGGVDHYVQAGVNNTLGDSSTPAAEAASDYSIGTVEGVTTSQRAAYVFATSGHVAGATFVSTNRIRTTAASVTISSGIQLFKDVGLSLLGVLTYNDSGRTLLNRLFNRRMSAAVDGPHGRAYYRAYLADGFGNALASTNVTLQTKDSDGTIEGTQSFATGAGGLIERERQFLPSDKAFFAFRRVAPDNPDSLGTHHIAIPTADVLKPAGTKTGTYPDPKVPTLTRDFSAATFPARAKDITAVGNVFGTKEPTTTAVDAFGLCGELIYAGMASVNAGDLAIDANGVPLGSTVRSKPTAAGSFFTKLSSRVNEATGAIIDPAAHCPTDRAGRPFFPSTVLLVGQRALFDRGPATAPLDTGSALSAQESQETPLGYSIHATGSQTFDVVNAPADATTFGYYQGFSNLSATRDSFGLDAGISEVPGFTVDNGLAGFKLQVLEFSIIRTDLVMEVVANPQNPVSGQSVRVKAKAWKILPDKTREEIAFDDAPVIYIDEEGGSGNPLAPFATYVGTIIGSPPSADYEIAFTPPSPVLGTVASFGIIGFGVIAGSRVTGTTSFSIGAPDRVIKLVVDIGNSGVGGGSHLISGSSVEVNLFALRADTGISQVLDGSPVPEVYIFRQQGNILEYLDLALTWQTLGAGGADAHPLTFSGDVWTKDLGVLNNLATSDIIVVGSAFVDGVPKQETVFREVVDTKNKHDKNAFDPIGISK